MSLLSEFEVIMSEKDKILHSTAINLHAALIPASPSDTGFLRKSWTVAPIKDGYLIHNSAIYADWATHKREVVRGKMLGSATFPDGIDPTIQKYNKDMKKRLKEIK